MEESTSARSWGNPWSERLPMTTVRQPQRRSLPDSSTREVPDDAANHHHHSQRNQARSSTHPARHDILFPSVKRRGWFSFITKRFRPAVSKEQLLSFESLTKIRCFGEIMIRLSDDRIDNAKWLKCRGDKSPLHLLLQYRPPLTVVNTVICELQLLGEEYPESMCDSYGRTSLHIACAAVPSNTVAVIARLVNGQMFRGCDNPAAIMDKQRMIPLHHACKGKGTKFDLDDRIQIIRFLTECYPQGVLLRNNRGMTPSDLVREGSNNPEIRMIFYHAIVDQRKAAAALPAVNANSKIALDQWKSSELMQKYTKSEHRRDGLAAFVQNNVRSMDNVQEQYISYDFDSDSISDFESMDTFGHLDETFTMTNDDANSLPENYSLSQSDGNKKTLRSAVVESDESASFDAGSLYTFGHIADDYSAVVGEKIHSTSSIMTNDVVDTESAEHEADGIASTLDISVLDYLYKSPMILYLGDGTNSSSVDDNTMQFSNSETYDEVEMMKSTTIALSETHPPLSKYNDTQESVDPRSTSAMVRAGSDSSPINKKNVQFHDRIQIHQFDTEIQLDDDDKKKSYDDLLDHTDPTESETTLSSPLDDSDRGGSGSNSSITRISEASTVPSLLMQRYGGHYNNYDYYKNNSEQCRGEVALNPQRRKPSRKSSTMTTSMYFV